MDADKIVEIASRVGPFHTGDAHALGLPRRALSSPLLRSDIRGTRVLASTPDSLALRLATVRLVLTPASVVTGDTAAWLYGLWNPVPGSTLTVDLTRPLDSSHPARVGVVGTQRLLRGSDIAEIEGLPVVTPLRAAFEQSRIQLSVQEAVARVDTYLNARLFTAERFGEYVSRLPGYRGVRMARWAAVLARCGAQSPGESRMRVQIALAGLPEPELQVRMVDARGREYARLDGGYRDRSGRVVLGLEYDGDVHLDPAQAGHDRMRDAKLLRDASVECLRFDREDTFHQRIAPKVRDALIKRGLFDGTPRYPCLPGYPRIPE